MPHRTKPDLFEGKAFGELLAEGLEEFAEALKTDKRSIPGKFNCRKVSLKLSPTVYSPELVRKTRGLLSASQAVFAQFLGVSVQAVRAWEQGINPPRDSARRLMDEIRHKPDYWRERIRELAVERPMTPRRRSRT